MKKWFKLTKTEDYFFSFRYKVYYKRRNVFSKWLIVGIE